MDFKDILSQINNNIGNITNSLNPAMNSSAASSDDETSKNYDNDSNHLQNNHSESQNISASRLRREDPLLLGTQRSANHNQNEQSQSSNQIKGQSPNQPSTNQKTTPLEQLLGSSTHNEQLQDLIDQQIQSTPQNHAANDDFDSESIAILQSQIQQLQATSSPISTGSQALLQEKSTNEKPANNAVFANLKPENNRKDDTSTPNLFSGILNSEKSADSDFKLNPNLTSVAQTKEEDFFAPPSGLKDVGLKKVAIEDLLLKFLYYQRQVSGKELASMIRLPLHTIVDPIMMGLSEEEFIEVTGTKGLGGHNRDYRLTRKGGERAENAMQMSTYVGPAPVSLSDYIDSVNRYPRIQFTDQLLREAYKDLVIDEKTFEEVGPALYSNKSMFLYGPAGTGKTSIAERINRCYKDTIRVPYCINIQGTPIRFFDFFLHTPANKNLQPGSLPPMEPNLDARWIEIQRPCIIVGPEFSIASTDIQLEQSGTNYQFPQTIKSNGGVFIVDDFGRQKESPEVLLNRWIIPLDKQKDILTFPKTGQQFSVPLKAFIVFSTNLDPKQLVDDAFLRRLAYKLKINFPSLETYCRIFASEAQKAGLMWQDDSLDYLIQAHYVKDGRPMRACDPKDLLARVTDILKFRGVKKFPQELTKELIDRACKSYFVGG